MEEKKGKMIYVRTGERLIVDCLTDAQSGEGYFLVKDGQGRAMRASEIVAGEVAYSADQRTRNVFRVGGEWLEEEEFTPEMIKDCREVMAIPFTAPKPG